MIPTATATWALTSTSEAAGYLVILGVEGTFYAREIVACGLENIEGSGFRYLGKLKHPFSKFF